jgi:hypothetical protein
MAAACDRLPQGILGKIVLSGDSRATRPGTSDEFQPVGYPAEEA